MKNFDYFIPDTIKEACSLLSEYQEKAKIIAGGQSLLILMKERVLSPSHLIDITKISGLDHAQYDDKEGLRIGALTTHRYMETSSLIKEKCDLLSDVEKVIASIQIRNVGTVGGNLCHADPGGDLAPPLIALEAKVKLEGRETERIIPLEDFLTDYFETALKESEILTEIQIPPILPYSGEWYHKCSPREIDPAIVGVAVALRLDSSHKACQKVRIVLGGVGPVPLRVKKAEERLQGNVINEKLIDEAAKIAKDEATPISDLRGTEEYKKAMVALLAKEGIEKALEKAKKLE